MFWSALFLAIVLGFFSLWLGLLTNNLLEPLPFLLDVVVKGCPLFNPEAISRRTKAEIHPID